MRWRICWQILSTSGDFDEPEVGLPDHALVALANVKRDLGGFIFDLCQARLLRHFAGEVKLSLMSSRSTWPRVRSRKAWFKHLTFAEVETLSDAQTNRCGLLADVRVDDRIDLRCCSAVVREHAWAMRPKRGTWAWAKWHRVSCPCCVRACVGEMGCGGIRRGMVVPQTLWHVLGRCTIQHEEEMLALKQAAGDWLERRLDDFHTTDAMDALRLLRGLDMSVVCDKRKEAALGFCLGLADTPVRDDEVGISLMHGYFRAFLGPIARLLRHAATAAHRACYSWERRDLFSCIRWRMHDSVRAAGASSGARPKWLTRSVWMRRRRLFEVWSGGIWSRKCFNAWRVYMAAVGPPWRGGGESMAGQWRCVRGGQMRCATSLSLAAQMLTECARSQRGGFCVPCVSGSGTSNSTGVTAA